MSRFLSLVANFNICLFVFEMVNERVAIHCSVYVRNVIQWFFFCLLQGQANTLSHIKHNNHGEREMDNNSYALSLSLSLFFPFQQLLALVYYFPNYKLLK